MNHKIQPTNHELTLKDNEFIVSKTDLSGKITYANHSFFLFSGYRQSETYLHQHKLVRHPDMPQTVFDLLWRTIKSGKEFNGYVKNMHKDGSFYWVLANVTPSFSFSSSSSSSSSSDIVGYYSVRRKPKKQALDTIIPLYQAMRQAELQANSSKDAMSAGKQILEYTLNQKEMDYDEFVLSL